MNVGFDACSCSQDNWSRTRGAVGRGQPPAGGGGRSLGSLPLFCCCSCGFLATFLSPPGPTPDGSPRLLEGSGPGRGGNSSLVASIEHGLRWHGVSLVSGHFRVFEARLNQCATVQLKLNFNTKTKCHKNFPIDQPLSTCLYFIPLGF
jgi:hypothetical protein